jgi:hypothetical protein
MSPALLNKYLEAARAVAEHLVLLPEGFTFAPHPAVTETDRDRFAQKRIIDFYQRQPTDLADYFVAAWRFHHRAALGQPQATLAEVAALDKVSPKYLATVWAALNETGAQGQGQGQGDVGPLAKVRAWWKALPAPRLTPDGVQVDVRQLAQVRADSARMRDWIVPLREKLSKRFRNLNLKAVATGSQPFILWKNAQLATHRTDWDPDELYVAGDPGPSGVPGRLREAEAALGLLTDSFGALAAAGGAPVDFGAHTAVMSKLGRLVSPPDPELAIPPGPEARARYQAAFTRFCRVFPDAFFVSERGRMHMDRPKEKQDKGRFLSAGYHNMFGYFRDDLPLYQMVLDADGQKQLDRLWRELDVVTDAPKRQHADFIFYERAEPPRTIKGPEFDFVRSEDKSSTSDAMIRRLAKVYLAKARDSLKTDGGDAHSIRVLDDYFKSVSANLRRVEREQKAAEPSHLAQLQEFAQRAYRRPLTAKERSELLTFYRSLRRGVSHEEAMRDTLASVLVSPHFLYRADLVASVAGRKTAAQPLSDHALASRLSYFLWSSLPDAELLAKAAAGELRRPEVLAAQARRMLRDDRARALAVEFGGNWLDFRRFEEHNGVDRQRFPSFDNELRTAMFEEPVRFFQDVVRQDGSVLDFLFARHTFVNPALAKHYGIPVRKDLPPDTWVRVDDAARYQRGGVLPLAVFLTRNAPGLRTSPVKRGYWVVRRALGEVIPAPPAQVPDLPNDESKLGKLTLRQALEQHRKDPSCAGCHARFDSFGLVFENYGPVGDLRSKDLGGRPVDVRAPFPGGQEVAGLDGLRGYLKDKRQDDFVRNLTAKLLSYGLGRTLLLSDDPFIDETQAALAAGGFHFGTLVERIVTSPQFLNKRGRDEIAQR